MQFENIRGEKMSKNNQHKNKKKRKKDNKAYKEKSKILKELKELKKDISSLELSLQEAKKEKVKQFHIRNLKVFGNTGKFIAPFVVCSGLVVGVVALLGQGTPFRVDKITKYKTYNIEYQTNGSINIDEEYKTNSWFDEGQPSNSLTVYTPWKLQDGQYIRFKREYNIGILKTLDLYNAVLEEDYDYINDMLKDYDEEKQIINQINVNQDNNYEMKASLCIIDKADILDYDETTKKNLAITIIELLIWIGSCVLIGKKRDFDFLYEVQKNNDTYYRYTLAVKNKQLALELANQKILSLTKSLGGKSYEK